MKTYPIEKVVPQRSGVEKPLFNSPELIIYQVCRYFNIKPEQLSARSRKGIHVLPRQIAMYRLNREANMTLWAIGKRFKRDHTSVLYSVNMVENDLQCNGRSVQHMENMANGITEKPKEVKVRKKATFTGIAEETKAQIYQMSARGYTQRTIAYKTGLHPDTIRKYQRLQTA